MTSDLLFLRDAYQRSVDAVVSAADGERIALDRTVFYPTGGGQPHDVGVLRHPEGDSRVVAVRKEGPDVWHTLDGPIPGVGTPVTGEIDWDQIGRASCRERV